jgi:hypothetical protein
MFSKVSTTTAAAIFRINIVGLEGRVGSSHTHTAAGSMWQVELWFQNMSNSWKSNSCLVTQECPVCYKTRISITVFTKARHYSISYVRWNQSIPFHLISFRITLIVSSHLRLDLASGLYPSQFQPQFCTSLMSATCRVHLILFELIILIMWRRVTVRPPQPCESHKGIRCMGGRYNWATLSVGGINTENWENYRVVNVEITGFCVVTPYSFVGGYRSLGRIRQQNCTVPPWRREWAGRAVPPVIWSVLHSWPRPLHNTLRFINHIHHNLTLYSSCYNTTMAAP